ncbi:hypothetical protein AAMO2058_000510200 [Amorphochlora amoebiformis]
MPDTKYNRLNADEDVEVVEMKENINFAHEEDDSPPWYSRITWENSQVSLVFLAFVTLRAIDRVLYKRVLDRMLNYQLMVTNFVWPIGVQIMTFAVACGWIYHHRRKGDTRYDMSFFSPTSTIASAKGAYSQFRLSFFSFFDQLNAAITTFPTPFLSQTMIGLLSNMGLVFTVFFSYLYLGTRYKQVHYIGCLLIVISGFVALTVELQTNDPPIGRYKDTNGEYHTSSFLWTLIYIVGTIPVGMGNAYKQKCLKSVDLEIMYASFWSGNWQILWGFLMYPVNWVPLPDPAPKNVPSETGDYIRRTFVCFMGTAPDPNNANDQACEARGGSAFIWFLAYLAFNVSFNVLFLWLSKRMSSTWAAVATVLCLDITSLLSMSKALQGDEAQMVTVEQYFGLVIAGVAMWVYNLDSEVYADGRDVAGHNLNGENDENTEADKNVLMLPPPSAAVGGQGSRAWAIPVKNRVIRSGSV